MANRYWVGGTANWDATAGTKWATTSGGAGGAAVPTAADDVFLDATSGAVTVTVTANPVLGRSLNCTGFTGTLAMASSSVIRLGDATAGAGNIALLFSAGMTFTFVAAATSRIDLFSTSTTTQTITTNGKTLTTITINGAGSKYQLADGLTTNIGATLTLTTGTLDTNNQTCVWGLFSSSNALTRTLTMGSSTITVISTSTAWTTANGTNMTITANTATLIASGAGSTVAFEGSNLNGLSLSLTGSGNQTISINGGSSCTLANITRTGTAVKTDGFSILNLATIICTGTLTITGNSTVNRILFQSSVAGTARSITAAVVSLTNVDFMDITAAGAASPFTGTSLGDALGNTNITFDTPATQTWNADVAGSWSDATKWTSRVPLPQDNVVFPSLTNRIITCDMPRIGKDITWGGTGNVTWTISIATGFSLYGSLTMRTGISPNGTIDIYFLGRSSHTITSGGATFAAQRLNISAIGGTYTLTDALSTNSSVFVGVLNSAGTFTTGGFSVTCNIFAAGAVGTTNLGASTINLTATTAVAVWGVVAGSIINAGTSNIVITNVSANTRTFTGAGKTYYNLTYNVANSPGALSITGANTFNNISIGSGRVLTMPSATTNTINGIFTAVGVSNGYVYLPAVLANYITASDSVALSIPGDITIDMKVAMDDWTPAVAQTLLAKNGNGTPNLSYSLSLLSGGQIRLTTSSNGTASLATDSAVTSVSDGAIKWVRVSLDVDDGGGNRVVKFYLSDDGTSWVQLGSTLTIAGITSLFDSPSQLEIGSATTGAAALMAGKVYNVKLYNAYLQNGSGTPVFDANFTTKAFGANSFTESSANAATVTINGSLAQAGDGRVLINSSTPASAATISSPVTQRRVDYATYRDITATGLGYHYAGRNSVDISGNTAVIFRDAPKASNFFRMMGA